MITYLIGAGASANALPLASGLSKGLEIFKEDLETFLASSDATSFQKMLNSVRRDVMRSSDLIQELIGLIERVLKDSKRHQTIDTYAKKLYMTNEKEKYRDLKILINVYFLYIQIIQYPDSRYDHFLASILNYSDSTISFPDNIVVFSWNYDTQIELAIKEYTSTINYDKNISTIGLVPNISTLKKESKENSIIKINGSSVLYLEDKELYLAPLFENIGEENKEYAISVTGEYYLSLKSTNKFDFNMISFGWEKENFGNIIRSNSILNRKLAQTRILVIIGYSFPYFNRKIDKEIFDSLPSLQKIYIQAPESDLEVLESRVNSFFLEPGTQKKIVQIPQKDQFFIPPEL